MRPCAFYRRPGDSEAYVLSRDQIAAKIERNVGRVLDWVKAAGIEAVKRMPFTRS
jgi:hypothetical protein